MKAIKPTPVADLLRKSEPTQDNTGSALRVTVVRTVEPSNPACWIADEVIDRMKQLVRNAQVADVDLTVKRLYDCPGCAGGYENSPCMYPCQRNDIESPLYKPDDAMLDIHRKTEDGDALLFVADARWGGLGHVAQLVIERFSPFANRAKEGHVVLRNKVAGVVVIGEGAQAVAGQAMGALSACGFIFPQHAFVAWHVPRNAVSDKVISAFKASRNVHDDADMLASDLVKFARLLK